MQEQICCEIPTKEMLIRSAVGEIIGTFLMCFFGIGAVAVTTIFGSYIGPFQVGMIWRLAIAITIYATRNLSAAHFNPAVTIAMCITKRCLWRNFPVYFISQIFGAILAGLALWVFFGATVESFRGNALMLAKSVTIWVEVFPNTTNAVITPFIGAFAEGLGAFILVIIIFSMTKGCNLGRPSDDIFPLFIGLTITCIIVTVGPMINAGLNPAKDFGPRLVGAFMGFKAFSFDAFIVYVLAPFLGGILGALFFAKVVEPLQKSNLKG